MLVTIFVGLLFFLIPGVVTWLYGISRARWGRLENTVAFIIGIAAYELWWLVGVFATALASDGTSGFAVLFSRMGPTLAVLAGFVGTIAGRLSFERHRR